MSKKGIEYLQSEEKRRLDLVGGTALAGALLPLAAAAGTALAIDSRSLNILLSQDRLGGHGAESFPAFKFRTLPKQAARQVVLQTFGTFDTRATKIGSFLRRSALDEIPQIVNVLRGDMSLVGIRPIPLVDVEKREAADPKLFAEWYEAFKTVKPGITGESQIYRHSYRVMSPEIYAHSMRMDLDYVESASLQQDIGWLVKTPWAMLVANMQVAEGVLGDVSEQTVPAIQNRSQ